MIVDILAVIGAIALLVVVLPVVLSLTYHPKVTIPGASLYYRWMDYWIDKSIEWEYRQ